VFIKCIIKTGAFLFVTLHLHHSLLGPFITLKLKKKEINLSGMVGGKINSCRSATHVYPESNHSERRLKSHCRLPMNVIAHCTTSLKGLILGSPR